MFAPSNGCRHNSYSVEGSIRIRRLAPEHRKKALAPSFCACLCVPGADVIYRPDMPDDSRMVFAYYHLAYVFYDYT